MIDGRINDALDDVGAERLRQEQLCAAGKFPHTCATSALTMPEKLAVLAEEFGEVSHEVTECINRRALRENEITEDERKRLREELIQVAAVAVAWAESLA